MENRNLNQSIDRLSEDLLKILESKRYKSGTMDNYRRILSRISNFMKERGIIAYTDSVGESFLAEQISKNAPSAQHQRQIKTILRRLCELSAGTGYKLTKQSPEALPPPQFAGLLEAYLEYCVSIGNKDGTIQGKRRFCREFLCHLADAGCNGVDDLGAALVGKAIIRLGNKDAYAVIRSFLRRLYETDAARYDFSGIIPKYRRHTPLPTVYTDDEINRVCREIDRTTGVGKRNYAIVLLTSRLGMRAGDVAEMTFDSISFSRNSIELTQNKTGQPLTLPLLQEIRDALLEYIRDARPSAEHNYVFSRANAPFERITTSVIRHALTGYFKAAGVDITNRKHGPHSLRSSMASSMVNSGVPYEVARKALGHADPQAIKHYAKLDVENLRFYAIDVPAPSGEFALRIQGRGQL
jgi:site-specific recombinase XerD